MTELEAACRSALAKACHVRGLDHEIEQVSRILPTACDARLVEVLEDQAQALGVSHLRLNSGAGHDAQIFGQYMPMGMIFVPSLNGISHSPQEWSSMAHIEAGANLLLRTLLKWLLRP